MTAGHQGDRRPREHELRRHETLPADRRRPQRDRSVQRESRAARLLHALHPEHQRRAVDRAVRTDPVGSPPAGPRLDSAPAAHYGASMAIKLIHHVNIQVSDRERTRAWYEKVLGAEFLDRGPALNRRQLQLSLRSGEIPFTL